MAHSLREEDGQRRNRLRTMVDLSFDGTQRMPSMDEAAQLIEQNRHANNWQDGRWGAYRSFTINAKDDRE